MYHITVQRTINKNDMPPLHYLKRWAKQTLKSKMETAELNIRVIGQSEMTELNSQYRHKAYPTNVLSFPFDMPEDIEETPFLGDIVICAPVVNQEAIDQNKTQDAHWAHMVVHGTLHLLGYDHETEADANIMEPEEIQILHTLGFANPYQTEENNGRGH